MGLWGPEMGLVWSFSDGKMSFLWSCQRVRFSRLGTLLQTIRHWVQQSSQGYTASALCRELSVELKAAIILFVSLLDEQQRRLWAGLESLRFGHGGDQVIAALLGIDPHTVARGRQQLLARDAQLQLVRKSGAGRPAIKKRLRSLNTFGP